MQKQAWPFSRCNRLDCKGSVAVLTGGAGEHRFAVAQRLAASLPHAIWSNQFDNTANRETHAHTTAPEIWAQTNGRIDAFVAASGTGGTFAGVAEFLKSRRREIRCVLADPPGSSLYNFVRSGTLKATGSGSIRTSVLMRSPRAKGRPPRGVAAAPHTLFPQAASP